MSLIRPVRSLIAAATSTLLLAAPAVIGVGAPTAAAATGCPPYSPLECTAVVPAGPTALSFGADAGGLADKAGLGTGFTMIQPNTAADQYQPANLAVDTATKQLVVTATPGIQYRTSNNLANGLGVGLKSAGVRSTLTTTVVKPFVPATARSEQAGLWFGPDQDNYVKAVVQSGGGSDFVQLTSEIAGTANGAPTSGRVTASDTVALKLVADAASRTVAGSYQINGGASVGLGTVSVPPSFFDGSTLASQASGASGFGGIFATSRNNTTPVDYHFGSFTAATAAVPAVPSGLTGTAGDGSVTLDWADNAAADSVTGYSVYRSDTTPVDTTGTPLKDGLATSAYTDTTAVNGHTYSYAVTATNAAGTSAGSAPVTATPDATSPATFTSPTKINFSAQTGDAVPGYIVDYGQAFANTRGFGWVVPGSSTPLSLVGNGRDRNDSTVADERQDSLLHMQGNDVKPPFNGVARPGAWELAVPNGSYDVEVGVGDPSPGVDPTNHVIDVEGKTVVDHYIVTGNTTGAARFTIGKATAVPVTDGHLTVDANGGTNTKIDYIVVTLTVAAPTELTATAADSSVTLHWTASTGATGYRVYRSTTGSPDTSGTPLNSGSLAGTSYTDTTAGNGTSYHYVVTALNAGAESGASNEVTATPTAGAVHAKVDFQPAAAPTPAGYAAENGQPYSWTTGRGWVRQDSLSGAHTPLDLNSAGSHTATSDGNTRDRNRAGIDQLQDTVIHMQYGDLTGTNTNGDPVAGAFEYAVPNGSYKVSVSVGDQPGGATSTCANPCYDSKHTINVEGVTAIDRFQETTAAEYKVATVTVAVSDGRLTIDAIGGMNTKLDYLVIDSAAPDTTAPAAPTGVAATASDSSVRLTWTANTEADLAGYNVYRSTTGTPSPATASPLNGTLLTAAGYTDTTASNGTTYTYAVAAVDTSGNTSTGSAPVSATPAPTAGTHLKVNFADQATVPPTGYLTDFGQAYGARSDANEGTGNTYGWVQVGTHTPVSLVGNGRNRNTDSSRANQPDLRLATFLHMQRPANAASGTPTR